MKKIIVLLLSGLFAHTVFAANRVVHVAMDAEYPPFHTLKENGKWEGYEVDLLKEICQQAQLTCEIHVQDFASIISSVRFKKYDIAMTALANNEDRRRVADFSTSYLKDEGGKIDFNTKQAGIEKLCEQCPLHLDISKPEHNKLLLNSLLATFSGKSFGFEHGSAAERYFNDNPELRKQIKVVFAEDSVALGKMLVAGDIAGASGAIVEEEGTDVRRSDFGLYGGAFGDGISLLMRKNETELKEKIDAAIIELAKNGTIKTLTEKWFEEDLTP